ncbi:thymidine kinase [Psychrobium sp. 1_MG-2023]|uniref:thymidine kinase n=1 Tax=Psychrobium sp. 1_MG-2023 TaxID=3062624 RepID=UPI000C32EE60|nr:thymidine kinase [Psychrobium sp. 1_MG-2023]MDP2560181.1 thymidine kinase [Psychrobium sp. 1_MG-2023]PKF56992.1 thymidine kinase [Alteromonadales bacterium alter-6D02]
MAQLYFYYSAMNAGKSTSLLQSAYNYKERGMESVILTASIDNRFGVGKVTSRIGLSQPADIFSRDCDLFLMIEQKLLNGPIHCILVDESQFLSKEQVKQLSQVVDKLNVPVLCYGLRTDFMGEPFEGSLYLMSWADKLVELKTICHCGRKATMVVRTDEKGNALSSGSQVEIGGNERYVSMCRGHFSELVWG